MVISENIPLTNTANSESFDEMFNDKDLQLMDKKIKEAKELGLDIEDEGEQSLMIRDLSVVALTIQGMLA